MLSAQTRRRVFSRIFTGEPYTIECYLPQITNGPNFPAWSPDGKRIAVTWFDAIWTMTPDGNDAKRLVPLERRLVRGGLSIMLVWHVVWFFRNAFPPLHLEPLYNLVTLLSAFALAGGLMGFGLMFLRTGGLSKFKERPVEGVVLREKKEADCGADRQIFDEAGLECREIDIEHHHNEEEQHEHRADIDHDQDHRQELGPQQDEQAGCVEEREDQKQNRVHGILGADDHEGGAHQDRGEEIEEQRA